MRSLLIEEKDKTMGEKIVNIAISLWPYVYNAVNGIVSTLINTVRRIVVIIFEQLGIKQR